jgi:N-methylhydantoinase A/oxoprolinase/acetone carboxylase beta subunit
MSDLSVQLRGRGYQVGIDVGGTFTDVVCVTPEGRLHLTKIPTTRADPSRAIRDALARMSADWGVVPSSIDRFAHGTTAGTNAVLERKGAKLGLVTTRGFRDVLEIGRQMRHRMYDMVLKPETPGFLAPGAWRREVGERVAADGTVVEPLDEAGVIAAIDSLVTQGAQAIAVCFLFSFVNPSHERRVRELVQQRHPGLMVSLSSEVDPAFREYERTTITAFDAYVKPVLDKYLANLEGHLADAKVPVPLLVMQSRGGLCSATVARHRPVRLFLSGPAAGVIGARMVGEEAGRRNLITADIGGTSCDISLICDGKPLVRGEGLIDGFPVRVPMVDVNAIGSGGGSIAWLDAGNSLRVGPESAGSEPGPACYGRGGSEPTVTDASVVLGYIDPNNFAAGSIVLDADRARKVIDEKLARPMDISVEEAALGIHRVVNAQMVEGVRLASIRRGYDPREFSLMPLGGGGALHATAMASELGIREVLVPRNPGVLCAYGLLAAPVQHELSSAFPRALRDVDAKELATAFAELDAQLAQLMAQEGIAPDLVHVQHSADLCYVGQSYHLEVPMARGASEGALERLYEDFLAEHERTYGHSTRAAVKIVNVRSVHQAAAPTPAIVKQAHDPRPKGQRSIRVAGFTVPVQATVVARDSLSAGDVVEGPAIVEQLDTTVLIEPGWTATIHASGHMVLTHNIGNKP